MENPQVTKFAGRGLLAVPRRPHLNKLFCDNLAIKQHPSVPHDVKVSWFLFVYVSIKQFKNKSSADTLQRRFSRFWKADRDLRKFEHSLLLSSWTNQTVQLNYFSRTPEMHQWEMRTTLLWTCSTNSSATLGKVKYSVFMYENTLGLTKQAEFKAVGRAISVPGIMRLCGELRLHRKLCLISAEWRGGKKSNIRVSGRPVIMLPCATHGTHAQGCWPL